MGYLVWTEYKMQNQPLYMENHRRKRKSFVGRVINALTRGILTTVKGISQTGAGGELPSSPPCRPRSSLCAVKSSHSSDAESTTSCYSGSGFEEERQERQGIALIVVNAHWNWVDLQGWSSQLCQGEERYKLNRDSFVVSSSASSYKTMYTGWNKEVWWRENMHNLWQKYCHSTAWCNMCIVISFQTSQRLSSYWECIFANSIFFFRKLKT